jgi:hypothetical protein
MRVWLRVTVAHEAPFTVTVPVIPKLLPKTETTEPDVMPLLGVTLAKVGGAYEKDIELLETLETVILTTDEPC